METGIGIAIILGIAQVVAASIALIATLNTNKNRKLKKGLKRYSREIYVLNQDLTSIVHAFSLFIKEHSIEDVTPLVDDSIRKNLRLSSVGYLGFNSNIKTDNNTELTDNMDIDGVKPLRAVNFSYLDGRKKQNNLKDGK